MSWQLAFGAVIATVCSLGTAVSKALPTSLVKRAEQATALVDVNTTEGRAFGSAFCINDKRIFITDGHVVADSKGPIKVVLQPGEKDERVLTAKVLGIDYDADIAVLQTDKPGLAEPLLLGNSENLSPTQAVTAFGYPFGNMLALDKGTYPSVTVNSGKVTALRKEKGDLRLIQVDALVNPGDSGGPVLDEDGRVIGIVESGVRGAGLNFATPVARLKKMIQQPLVLIDPIAIDYVQRTKKRPFSIQVNSLSHISADYDLELKITDTNGASTSASGKTSGGKCDLQLTPTADDSPLKWDPFTEPPPSYKFVLTLKISDKTIASLLGNLEITNLPFPGEIAKGKPGANGKRQKNPTDALPADSTETRVFGGGKNGEMREVNADEQLATGVCYTTTQYAGKPVIESIHLIYPKSKSNKGETIPAKDGYVVGGLVVNTGQFLNGFQVIFIRRKEGKLDTKDTYTSDLVGDSAGRIRKLAGDGEEVIGLCGRRGLFVRAIGLVVRKPAKTPTTQATEK